MDTTVAATLKERLTGRVARHADRREDWSVFGFETALDPRYARAQRRYLGASGSTDPSDLRGSIPATAFTMSIQTCRRATASRYTAMRPRRCFSSSTANA